jgi:hypothetical protein
MATRARRLGASLAAAVALALAGSLAAVAPPADAYYLRATDLYHFPAWNPGLQKFLPQKGGRWLRLDDGYYKHGAYFAHTEHRTDPDLAEERIAITAPGMYRWRVHRWWGKHHQQYYVKSKLSGGSLPEPSIVLNELSGNHVYGKEGMYEWGGRLAYDGAIGITEPQPQR